MNYGLSSFRQLSNFLSSVGFGFFIGLVYVLFQFVRSLISDGKIAFLVCDILFSVTYTLLCFIFMLAYTDGEMRVELLIAMAIGFFVFFFSLGKYLQKLLSLVSGAFSCVCEILFLPSKKIAKLLRKTLKKSGVFLINKLKINKTAASKPKKDSREKKKENKLKNNHRKSKQNFKRHLKKFEKSV